MKFAIRSSSAIAATLLGLANLSSAAAADAGQCIKGQGEFTFRGAVDAHFTVDACLEDSTTKVASGHLKSGQFNKDGDVFHYNVHCMDTDGSTVYVGAEIQELSEYVATHQNPESFRQSLVDGDAEYIMEYERKVFAENSQDPKYLEALEAFLDTKGVTMEQYEKHIGLDKEGGERRLTRQRRAKGGKGTNQNAIPLQVTQCAEFFISQPPICDGGEDTDPEEFTWDLDALDLTDSEEEGYAEDLYGICYFIALFTCAYTSECLGGDCRRRRNLLEASSGAGDQQQGTLALFQLRLDDEEAHSIAVKLGHEFDTSCAGFGETIDHGFFTAEMVDELSAGELALN